MNESSAEAMLLGRTPGTVGRAVDVSAGAERLLENRGLDECEFGVAREEGGGGIGSSTIRRMRHEAVVEVPTRNRGIESRKLRCVVQASCAVPRH